MQVFISNEHRPARYRRPKREPSRAYGMRGLLANLPFFSFEMKSLRWLSAQASSYKQGPWSRALSAPEARCPLRKKESWRDSGREKLENWEERKVGPEPPA